MDVPQVPGLDFDPSSNELLSHYLKQRILDYQSGYPEYSTNRHLIPDIELYNWDPKDLPRQYERLSDVRSNGRQWFFFCLRREKYRNSSRSERTVSNVGYWKITSSEKRVKCDDTEDELGKKNTLTFYRGRIPNGTMTKWGMHEYCLNPAYSGDNGQEHMPFVVCRVFKRTGRSKGRDDDAGSSSAADDSSNLDTSESHAPQYNQATSNEEQGMWNSLSDIQQLPGDLPNYGFSERAGYQSYGDSEGSFGGYGSGSSGYYAYPSESNYYHQQGQGGWNSGF